MIPETIDIKTLAWLAGIAATVFLSGFWAMKNLTKIVTDQTDGIKISVKDLSDTVNERLDQVEKKQAAHAAEATVARGKIYQNMKEMQVDSLTAIHDIETHMNEKFVRTETMDLVTAGNTHLVDTLGTSLNAMTDQMSKMYDADKDKIGHARAIADDIRRTADTVSRKMTT